MERTFERICCDFRHRDVRLIDLVQVETRVFGEWGMACLSHEGDDAVVPMEAIADIRFMADVNAREAIVRMRALLGNDGGDGR